VQLQMQPTDEVLAELLLLALVELLVVLLCPTVLNIQLVEV